MTLQQPTLDQLNNFAGSVVGGENSQAYQAIFNSLVNSPELANSVNKGILSGDIKGFSPTTRAGVGGQFDPISKTIQIPVDPSTGALANGMSLGTMVFVMAHETQHSYNAPSVKISYNQFTDSVDYLAQSSLVQDYTSQLLAIQKVHARDEATAQISGWNAVVSQVNAGVGGHQYSEYRYAAGGYADYFLTAGGAAQPGLSFSPDFSLQYSESNINAESELFFYNPNVRVGLTNYPNYYGSQELAYIAAAEGYEEISLDMAALRFDAFVIKNNNLLGLMEGQSIKINDIHTLVGYKFDNTGHGQNLEVEKPIPLLDGKQTETLVYDEYDKIIAVEHDWEKNDGSRGHDSTDSDGNIKGTSIDAASSNHWFFKYVSGAQGNGYSNLAENFSEIYNSDGSFNKYYSNSVTSESSSSYKRVDGTVGDAERHSDGSTHDYNRNADGSYSESFKNADGSSSYESRLASGIYSKNERSANGSSHDYTIDVNGYFTESYVRADGSSSYESFASNGFYNINIKYSDSSTYSKSVSPDGSIYIKNYYFDGSYNNSYTLLNGEISHTEGDGGGNEDTHIILENGNKVHTWKDSDGSSGSKTIDEKNDVVEYIIDSDKTIHENFYEEDGDYLKITTHTDETWESEKYNAATDIIGFETHDIEQAVHSYGYSVSNPGAEYYDGMTYADSSGYGQAVRANGDYSYSTTDHNGIKENSFRTMFLTSEDDFYYYTEGETTYDRIGVIKEETDYHFFRDKGQGFTEQIEHVSVVRTDPSGYDRTTFLILTGGVEGMHETTHFYYG